VTKESGKRSKGKTVVALVAVIVAVLVALFTVNAAQAPKYSGYPSQVAQQVGPIGIQDQNGPIVELTVSAFTEDEVEMGENTIICRDPLTGEPSGFIHLEKPTTRSYFGTFKVRGVVSQCDGVQDISIGHAEIVSGG